MPQQNELRPERPRRSTTSVIAAVALVSLIIVAVPCAGLCAGLWWLMPRAETAFQRAKAKLQIPGLPISAPTIDERMQAAFLTPLYKMALDAVASNKDVLARLGGPIETIDDGETMYRRQGKGSFNWRREVLEFDVQGTKGKAVVKVIGGNSGTELEQPYWGLQATKITVVLEDGTRIDVPVPAPSRLPQ